MIAPTAGEDVLPLHQQEPIGRVCKGGHTSFGNDVERAMQQNTAQGMNPNGLVASNLPFMVTFIIVPVIGRDP
jgi:hypothetical protein